ncbi:MAG: LEPR-XLL domain-containing protein, partial [Methylococcaceae bacterium]
MSRTPLFNLEALEQRVLLSAAAVPVDLAVVDSAAAAAAIAAAPRIEIQIQQAPAITSEHTAAAVAEQRHAEQNTPAANPSFDLFAGMGLLEPAADMAAGGDVGEALSSEISAASTPSFRQGLAESRDRDVAGGASAPSMVMAPGILELVSTENEPETDGLTVDLGYGGHIDSGADITLAQGDILRGSGDIERGVINNEGTVAPGNSPGVQNLASYTQGADGTLVMELGGSGAGSYDQLNIAGAASLDGKLDLRLYGSYLPSVGDTFDILNYSSASGNFAKILGQDLGNGLYLNPVKTETSFQLVVTERLDQGSDLFDLIDTLHDKLGGPDLSHTISLSSQQISGDLSFDTAVTTTGGISGYGVGLSNVSLGLGVGTTSFILQNASGALFVSNADNTPDSLDHRIAGSLTADKVTLAGISGVTLNAAALDVQFSTFSAALSDTFSVDSVSHTLDLAGGDYFRLSGTMDLDINGFATLNGDIEVSRTGQKLTLGTANMDIWMGNADQTIGAQITGADLGMAVYPSGKYALAAAGNGELVGVPGFTLSGAFTVQYNNAGSGIHETIAGQTLDYSGNMQRFGGNNLTASIDGLASISGNFYFSKTGGAVDSRLLISGNGIDAYIAANAVKAEVQSALFAMVVEADGGYALQANGTSALTGVTGLTLTGDLGIAVNTTGAAVNETIGGVDIQFADGSTVSQFQGDDLTVAATGFINLNGAFTFEKTSQGGVDEIQVSAGDVSARLGTDSTYVGLSQGSLGLLLPGDGGYAMVAAGLVSLVGGGNLSLSGRAQVRVNNTGKTINRTIGGVLVEFDDTSDVQTMQAENAALAVDGFVQLEGNFSFSKTGPPSELLIGATDVKGGLGVADLAVQIENGQLGLVVQANDQYALSAAGDAALTGIDALTLSGTLHVDINTTGGAIDRTPAIGAAIHFDSSEGNIRRFTGSNLDLSVAGFAELSGTFSFISDANNPDQILASGSNIAAFLGAEAGQPDELGVRISNAGFGLVLEQGAVNSYAIAASGSAALAGISGLSISGTIAVRVNTTGSAVHETINGVNVDFNNGVLVQRLQGDLALAVDNFLTLNGAFDIEKTGPPGEAEIRIAAVDVTTRLGDDSGPNISLSNANLAAILYQGGVTNTYALAADGLAALNGVAGLSFSGQLGVRINTTGQAIDETIADLPLQFADGADVQQLSGLDLSLNIAGLVQLAGDFTIEQRTAGGVSRLWIGAQHVSAFVGVGGGADDALGVSLNDGQLGLLLERSSGANRYALIASGSVALQGIDAIGLSGTLQVEVNTLGRAVAEDVFGVAVLFEAADDVKRLSGENLNVDLDGFAQLSGNLYIEKKVDADSGDSRLIFSMVEVSAFVGANGGSANAVGVQVTGLSGGFILYEGERTTYALDVSGSIALLGVPDVTAEGTVRVAVNTTGEALDENLGGGVRVEFANGNKLKRLEATGLKLSLLNLAEINGNFLIEKETYWETDAHGDQIKHTELRIAAADVSAFLGSIADDAEQTKTGLQLSEGQLAMVLYKTAGEAAGYALEAEGAASLLNVDGVSLDGTAAVRVNTTGAEVDETLSLKGEDIALVFDSADLIYRVEGTLQLAVAGFVEVDGAFSLEKRETINYGAQDLSHGLTLSNLLFGAYQATPDEAAYQAFKAELSGEITALNEQGNTVKALNLTVNGYTYNELRIDLAADKIDLGSAHGFYDGQSVLYSKGAGNTLIGGLSDDTVYRVKVVDATTIKLKDKTSGAVMDLSAAGTGTQTLTPVLDFNAGNVLRVDTAGERINFAAPHGLADGQLVRYETDGQQAIGGLSNGTRYYVKRIDAKTLQLSATLNGAAVDLTVDGQGTQRLVPLAGFNAGNDWVIDTVRDIITFPAAHGLASGQTITYVAPDRVVTPLIGGLVEGADYKVIKLDDNRIQLARNGRVVDLTSDQAGTHWFGSYVAFDPSNVIGNASQVSIENDTITFPSKHGWQTGDKIIYKVTGGNPISGLDGSSIHWVIRVNDYTVKLANSEANALNYIANVPYRQTVDIDRVSGSVVIQLTSAHNLLEGQAVKYETDPAYQNGASALSGLKSGNVYYVHYAGVNSISLAESPTALANHKYVSVTLNSQILSKFRFRGLAEDITYADTGNHVFYPFFTPYIEHLDIQSAAGKAITFSGLSSVQAASIANLVEGQAVIYDTDPNYKKGASALIGLQVGGVYYVHKINDGKISLALSQDALSQGKYVDVKLDTQVASSFRFRVYNQVAMNSVTRVNATSDTITFDTPHGFSGGDRVGYVIWNDSKIIPGLTDLTEYKVDVVNAKTIRLLNASTGLVMNLGNGGSGYHTLINIGHGAVASVLHDPLNTLRVSLANDTISLARHGLLDGERVVYEVAAGDAAIGGLSNGQSYYVKRIDADTVQLSATLNGSAVNLTRDGSGTQYLRGAAVSFDSHNLIRVDVKTDRLYFDQASGFRSGQTVIYQAGATAIGGLQDGVSYRVRVLNPYAIQLWDISGDDSVKANLTSDGAGTARLIGEPREFRATTDLADARMNAVQQWAERLADELGIAVHIGQGSANDVVNANAAPDVESAGRKLTFTSASLSYDVRNTVDTRIAAAITDTSVFLGVNAGTEDELGVRISDASLGLLIFKTRYEDDGATLDTGNRYAMTGEGTGALVNIPGITLNGTLKLEINRSGAARDETLTTPTGSVTFDFADGTDLLRIAGTDIELAVNGLAGISGNFYFEKTGSDMDARLLISGNGIDAYIAAGTAKAEVQAAQFAMLVEADGGYALQANGTAAVSGVPGLALSGNLAVEINTTGAAVDETIDGVAIQFADGTALSRLYGDNLTALVGNGFIDLNGAFTLEKATQAGADEIQISATEVNAKLGGTDTYVGLNDGNLGLLLPGDGHYALVAAGLVSLVGGGNLSLSGRVQVRINNTGRTLSRSIGGVLVAFGDSETNILAMQAENAELAVAGFVQLGGNFSFNKTGPPNNAELLIGAGDVSGGLGVAGLAVQLQDGQLGLYVKADHSYALSAEGTAALTGIDAITLSGTLHVDINTTGGAVDKTPVIGLPVQFAAGEGSVQRFNGDLQLAIAGFAQLSGVFSFESGANNLILASGSDIDAFLGANAGSADEFGVRVSQASFGLLLKPGVTNTYALSAAGSAALVGFDGVLSLDGSIAVQVNTTGAAVNQTIGGVQVQFDDGALVQRLQASSLNLDIAGFLTLNGAFDIEKTGPPGEAEIRIAAIGVTTQLGLNNAPNLTLSNANLAAILYQGDEANTYALAADGSVALNNVTGLALSGQLGVRVNTTGSAIDETIGELPLQFADGDEVQQLSGLDLNLDIAGLIQLAGNFTVEQRSAGGSSRLWIGAQQVEAFVGVGGGSDDALGVKLSDGQLGLLLERSTVNSVTANRYALIASGTLALQGISQVSLSGTLQVEVNTLGRAVDENVFGVDLLFEDGDAVKRLQATDVDADLGGFAQLSGNLYIEKKVDAGSGDSRLVFTMAEVSAFIGTGGGSAGAVGAQVSELSGGFILYQGTTSTYALDASGSIALLGVPGLSAQGTVRVAVNTTGRALNETLLGGAQLAFDNGNKLKRLEATGLALALANLAELSGDFSIEKTSYLETDADGNSIKHTELRIAATGVDAFLGSIATDAGQSKTGLQLSAGRLAMILYKTAGESAGYALNAAGAASLLNVDGVSLAGTAAVRVNTTGDTVDETLSVGGSDMALLFVTPARVYRVDGTLHLAVAGFVDIDGAFSFEKSSTPQLGAQNQSESVSLSDLLFGAYQSTVDEAAYQAFKAELQTRITALGDQGNNVKGVSLTVNGYTYNELRIDLAGDKIDLGGAHGFYDGQSVLYGKGAGNTVIGGLSNNSLYKVKVVDETTIQLTDKTSGAVVDLSAAGTGTQTLTPVLDFQGGNTLRVDTSSERIIFANPHGLADGALVRYETDGQQAIGGLGNNQNYYVKRVDATTLQLSASLNGAAIDLTSDGRGVQRLVPLTRFNAGNDWVIDTQRDVITFPGAHGFRSGQTITYVAPDKVVTPLIGGLIEGADYQVIKLDDNRIQIARNGKVVDLTSDQAGTHWFGSYLAFDPSNSTGSGSGSINTTADTVTFTGIHNWQTGDKIVYRNDGTQAIGGIGASKVLYVIRIDDTTIKLADSAAMAQAYIDSVPYRQNTAIDKVSGSVVIALKDAHNLVEGQAVKYEIGSGASALSGLTPGNVYYVHYAGVRSISLAVSPQALANHKYVSVSFDPQVAGQFRFRGLALDLTSSGVGDQTFYTATLPYFEQLDIRRTTSGNAIEMMAGSEHGLTTGMRVVYQTDAAYHYGASPLLGLQVGGVYFVKKISANQFKLAVSLDALNQNQYVKVGFDDGIAGKFRFMPTQTVGQQSRTHVDVAGDKIIFDKPHGFQSGDLLGYVIWNDSRIIGGLTDLTRYTAQVVNATTLQLKNAQGNVVNLTSDGAGYHTLIKIGDATHRSYLNDPLNSVRVDATADSITIPGHGLSEGARLVYEVAVGDKAIAGLVVGNRYYVHVLDKDHVQLRLTANGAAVDLSSDGSGIQHLAGAAASFLSENLIRVDVAEDVLHFTVAHGLVEGQTVRYSASGDGRVIGGLKDDAVYVAHVLDLTSIQLRLKAEGAIVDLTGAGVGGQRFTGSAREFVATTDLAAERRAAVLALAERL